MMKKAFLFFILFGPILSNAQSFNIPLNRDLLWDYDKKYQTEDNSHTTIKPYLFSKVDSSTTNYTKDSSSWSLKNNVLSNHLFEYQKGSFYLNIDPEIDLTTTNAKYYQSEYGIRMNAQYKKKLGLWIKLNNGVATLPNYLDALAKNKNAIPGRSYAYDKGSYYSYSDNEVVLSYEPNKVFNFQAGKGNHFWGNGYRTFYLSDNSTSLPFFKITTEVWHLKYTALWTQQSNLLNKQNGNAQKINSAFHHLSWNISEKLNIGIYEAVIWNEFDTIGGKVVERGWEPQYANPFIFFRPIEYSLGSPDNVLVGADLRYTPNKNNQIYFQLVLDELIVNNMRQDIKKVLGLNYDPKTVNWWGNKYAIQLGWKSYEIFKTPGLDIQTEFNMARPYTFTHKYDGEGLTNYNKPMAHPLGANFYESVNFVRYKKDRFMIEGKLTFAVYGADTSATSYGSDLLKSYTKRPFQKSIGALQEYGVEMLQGLRTNLSYQDVKFIYFINPKSNLRLEGVVSHRIQSSSFSTQNNWFFSLGIKTTLGNSYRDF